MTTAELIKLLQTMPQDLPVAYALYSEYCLLDAEDIKVMVLGKARPDGWVSLVRTNNEHVDYLVFPGN